MRIGYIGGDAKRWFCSHRQMQETLFYFMLGLHNVTMYLICTAEVFLSGSIRFDAPARLGLAELAGPGKKHHSAYSGTPGR